MALPNLDAEVARKRAFTTTGDALPNPDKIVAAAESERQERAKRTARPAPVTSPPKPTPKPDLGGVVLATGETYGDWLNRRFASTLNIVPKLGPAFALDLASMPIADAELESNAQNYARSLYISGGTAPAAVALSTQQRTALLAKAEVQPVLRRSILDRMVEDMPDVRETAEGRISKRFAGRTDIETLKLKIEDSDLEAVAFPGLNETELRALRIFYPDTYREGIDQVRNHEGVVQAEMLTIASGVDDAITRYSEGLITEQEREALEEMGGIEKALTSTVAAIAPLTEGLENIYRVGSQAVGVPLASAVDFVQGARVDPLQRSRDIAAFGPGRTIAFSANLAPGSAPFNAVSTGTDFAFRIFADPANILGEFAAGAKLAERLVITGAKQVPARGLRGSVARFLAAKSPEELMQTARAQRNISRMFIDIEGLRNTPGGVYQLADRYTIPFDWAEDLAAARSVDEVQGILTDAMYGRLSQRTINELQGRFDYAKGVVDDVKVAVKGGEPEATALGRILGTELTDEAAESTLSELRKMARQARGQLTADKTKTIIRSLPDPSAWKRMRSRMKVSKTPPLRALDDYTQMMAADRWVIPAFKVVEGGGEPGRFREWISRPTGRIPQGHLSLKAADRDAATKQLAEVAHLTGLSKQRALPLVEAFARSTSHEEAYVHYSRLLQEAAQHGKLPPALAKELTRFSQAPSFVAYASDGGGPVTWQKVRNINGFDVKLPQPVFYHQISDSLPLPDMFRIIRERSYSGRFQEWLRQARRVPKTARGLAATIGGVQDVAGAITSVWKVGVLARLGWPLRVVSEEQLRLFSVGAWVWDDSPLNIFAFLRKDLMDAPEEALADMGHFVARRSERASGFIPKTDRQFFHHLNNNIARAHSDPVIRYYLRHGKERTTNWLLSGRGREALDEYSFILKETTGSSVIGREQVEAWVDTMEAGIKGIAGNSRTIRHLIAEGALPADSPHTMLLRGGVGKYRIGDDLTGLLRHPDIIDDLPENITFAGMHTLYGGRDFGNRAAAKIMEYLGSKPTNALSRSPAFRFFYKRERERLVKQGIARSVANRTAKQHAIEQVGNLLYDAGERTATDVLIRNLAPFFPAWKEVLQRWAVTIPGEMGYGIGHAVLARRLETLWNAMKDAGQVKRNAEGEWEVRSGGYDALFSFFLGIPGLKTGIDPRTFNLLGSWPGVGPLPTVAVALLVKDAGKLQPLYDALFPYGATPEVGPRGLSRVLRALGLKPFWDIFDSDYQSQVDANSFIDVVRARKDEFRALLSDIQAAVKGDITDAQREEFRARYRELWDDARAHGGHVMLWRGLLGLVVPAQPRLIWPGQEEAEEVRAIMEGLDESFGQGLFKDWLAQDPIRELFFVAKTERIDGQIDKDLGLEEYRKQVAEGLRRSLGDDYAAYAAGDISYSMIRQRKFSTIADLGTNFNDILRNGGWQYQRALIKASLERERLKALNPTWGSRWEQAIAAGRRAAGAPVPTADEELAEDTARNLSLVSKAFDIFNIEDLGQVRAYAAKIREDFDLGKYYDRDTFGTTLERQEAEYYDATDAYWNEVNDIYTNQINGKTADERDAGFRRLRELRMGWKPIVIDGVEYPHPEHAAYLRRSPEEKRFSRMKWATGKMAWLTPWQREELGLKSGEPQVKFWNEAERLNDIAFSVIAENGWGFASKEATSVKDAVNRIIAARSKSWGTEAEWKLSQLPAYKRISALGVVPRGAQRAWERVNQVVGQVRATIEIRSSTGNPNSIDSDAGREVYRGFTSWMQGFRRNEPELDRFLTSLQAARGLTNLDYPARTDTTFYPFLFFKTGG